MTRIAEVTPIFCTACHGQYPERRHVDFEAAYDGPIMQIDGAVPYPIEDLVLCEDCVRSAADALSFEAEPDVVLSLRVSVQRLTEHIKRLQKALKETAVALEQRPEEALPRKRQVRKEQIAA